MRALSCAVLGSGSRVTETRSLRSLSKDLVMTYVAVMTDCVV